MDVAAHLAAYVSEGVVLLQDGGGAAADVLLLVLGGHDHADPGGCLQSVDGQACHLRRHCQ